MSREYSKAGRLTWEKDDGNTYKVTKNGVPETRKLSKTELVDRLKAEERRLETEAAEVRAA